METANNGNNGANGRLARYVLYILIGLGILLVVLFVFLAFNYRALRHAQLVNAREFLILSIVRNHGPLTANDVNIIRPWMTFDYINKIFNLPASYLKASLSVADPHYPQISLGSYAREISQNSNAFAITVETAVDQYLKTKPQ